MKEKINYKLLIVNPENYRFDPVDTQEQAVDLMLAQKGIEIFNLAKHILEKGLDGAKDFRVVKTDQSHYLVLDGNRRATAIKCLHDTSIIKEALLKSKFDNLKIDKAKIPAEIQCFVYSSEGDAAEWIKLDHTGKNQGVGQDPWGSTEIDRYGYKFEGKISPALQAVEKIESEMGIKFDTKKLKITTVKRILSNPESRSYLGVDIKNKKLVFTADQSEAVDRLNKLFSKIINDKVNVAKVYTSEKSNEFMKQLFGDKPRIEKPQPVLFTEVESGIGQKEKMSPSILNDPTESFRQERSNKIPSGLFSSSSVPFKIKSSSLRILYEELRTINVSEFPNATHDLLRSFLECSLIFFLKEVGEFSQVQKGSTHNPKLGEMLSHIINGSCKIINDINLIDVLKQVKRDFDMPYSLERMNMINHNENCASTEKDVRKAWAQLEGLFKIILNP